MSIHCPAAESTSRARLHVVAITLPLILQFAVSQGYAASQGDGAATSRLSGVVLDPDGNAIIGARVAVSTVAARSGPTVFCASRFPDCSRFARTGDDGRFSLDGLDGGLKFRLLVTARGWNAAFTAFTDPAGGPVNITLHPRGEMEPDDRTVAGVVLNEQGEPLANALIEARGAKTEERRWWGRVDVPPTATDHAGQFTMRLPDGYLGVELTVTADGLAGAATELLEPGAGRHRITVGDGADVTGRLVDAGVPVVGAFVAVVQLERGARDHFLGAVRAKTDADGRFVFKALPGAQKYVVYTPWGNGERALRVRRFSAPDSGARDLGDLSVEAAVTVRGRIRLPEGLKLPTQARVRIQRDPAWDLVQTAVRDDGTFEFPGLAPEAVEIRVVAGDLELVPDELKWQQSGTRSVAVFLNRSLPELELPLREPIRLPDAIAPENGVPAEEVEGNGAGPAIFARTIPKKLGEPIPGGGPRIDCRGVVTSPKGRPIPGAWVALRVQPPPRTSLPVQDHDHDLLASTRCDAEGRFHFKGIGIPPRWTRAISTAQNGNGGLELVASAPDRPMSWHSLSALRSRQPVRIVLDEGIDFSATLKSDAGAPISPAFVGVDFVAAELTRYERRPYFRDEYDLTFSEVRSRSAVRVDGDGRFHMRLPKNRVVFLSVKAPGFESTRFIADTCEKADEKLDRFGIPVVRDSGQVITVAQHRLVRVRVVDHQGQPVRHGNVGVFGGVHRWNGIAAAVGEDGIAECTVKGAGRVTFRYAAGRHNPLPGRSLEVEVGPGSPDVIELRLPEFEWLLGEVVDAGSGEPVVGATVSYTNHKSETDASRVVRAMAISGPDGGFRIPAASGPGELAFVGEVAGFVSPTVNGVRNRPRPRTFEVRLPNADQKPVRLELPRGLTIRGRVLDASGTPVAEATVHARNADEPGHVAFGETDDGGEFLVSGLAPNVISSVIVEHRGRAVQQFVLPDIVTPDASSREVRMDLRLDQGAVITGRVTRAGHAVPGVPLELRLSLPDRDVYYLVGTVRTDKSGQYGVAGLLPGQRFRLEPRTTDLFLPEGGVNTIRGVGERRVPDLVLRGKTSPLRGVVVDRAGKAVAGATVLATADVARRSRAIRAETDAHGEFTMDLPDQPMLLVTHHPRGRNRALMSQIMRHRGQSTIRILLDPSLQQEIEDLD